MLLLSLVLLITETGTTRTPHFTFASFGASSGLSNLNITTVLEDHMGMIWVGTQSGIFTADGTRFEKLASFSAAGLENVRALREDDAHRIWAVDGRHLAFWQGGSVHSISGIQLNVLSHEALSLEVLPAKRDTIYLLRAGELIVVSSEDKGKTWAAKPALSAALLAAYPQLAHLTSFASQGNTTLWAGCGKSLCRIDPVHQTVAVFGAQQGVPADNWRFVLVTREGAIWARGEHRVLLRPSNGNLFEQPALQPPLGGNPLKPMLVEDLSGKILLNTNTGVARLEPGGWQNYGQPNGLPEDSIDVLMFDRAGGLWFGSLGHGLLRWYGYGNWETWTRAEGLSSNIIWSISQSSSQKLSLSTSPGTSPSTSRSSESTSRSSSQALWIATDKGVDKLEQQGPHSVIVRRGVVEDRVFSVVVDARSHVWSASATGNLTEWDPGTGRRRTIVDNLERIFALHIDREQRIWICSRRGLFFLSPDDLWAIARPVPELGTSYAWALAEGPQGTIWVSNGTGLYRLQGKTWSMIKLPFLEGKAYNFMFAVAPDGTLWLQGKSPYPVLHVRVDGQQASILNQVDSREFGSDNITFVETDRRGWVWIGSDDGLHVFNGNRWARCTAEEGLIWDDTNFHAFFADPDGSIWIGTSAGLSHLLEPERIFAMQAPVVHVMGAAIAGAELQQNRTLALDLRTPTLSVRLLDTNYGRGSATVTRVRLNGEENEWQDASSSQIRFPSLYPGHYNLQVFTYDRHLYLSSPVQSYPFVLLEPWWKRPRFIAIPVLAAVALLLGIWSLSVRLLVARQQALERLVAERTEELEREKKELLVARSELLEITRRDPLTGLLNRRAIFEHMQALCSVARDAGRSIAVVMADLDNFKRVNDIHGHVAGDAVLQACARRISSVTRPVDYVGRYGGEELLILMPGLDPHSVRKRMEEIRLAIAGEPVPHASISLNVTCSFGVAWFSGGEATVENLVTLADTALYAAKRNGRNRVEYAPNSDLLEGSLVAG